MFMGIRKVTPRVGAAQARPRLYPLPARRGRERASTMCVADGIPHASKRVAYAIARIPPLWTGTSQFDKLLSSMRTNPKPRAARFDPPRGIATAF